MIARKNVLIIEDDKWLAENHARVIKNDGYKVLISNHALSAIKVIDEFKPDVIILDVVLTGYTAFTLLNELQSYEDTGKIPIIVCSNVVENLEAEELYPYGVRSILDKSKMLPGDLLVELKRVL